MKKTENGLPIDMDRTAISVMKDPNFDLVVTSIIAIFPIAFATQDLLNKCDQRMYISKRDGKHRITY